MPYVDANRFHDKEIHADVAIVGAGAAGIALARELADNCAKVALIVGGDFQYRHRNQSLYLGDNIGRINISPLFSRFRSFGGSTTRWGGQCRPLDPIDFEARDGIKDSGWPFDYSHLESYYRRAQILCMLGPFEYDPANWSNVADGSLPLHSELLQTRVYQFSYPSDFGVVYRHDFQTARNIDVYLNAHLIELRTDAAASRVLGLSLATTTRRMLTVHARHYVLACGGIENARLLLASDRVRPNGIGNDHDLVGRYFMDHPYIFPGYYQPADTRFNASFYVIDDYQRAGSEQKMHGAFTLSDRLRRQEGLNGSSVYLLRRPRHKAVAAYSSAGGRALSHLIEILQHREHADGRLRQDVKTIAADFTNVCRAAWGRLRGCFAKDYVLALRFALEGTPCPESRVTLGHRKDRFGMRRVNVHWRLKDADKRGYQRLLEVMRQEFQRLGLGRLVEHGQYDSDGWPSGMIGGKHHMGTTRMHEDPRQGVVDPDCKVHGMNNLHIAGSSVFPTGGYANPTLTLVALAIRLADRLKARLQSPGG